MAIYHSRPSPCQGLRAEAHRRPRPTAPATGCSSTRPARPGTTPKSRASSTPRSSCRRSAEQRDVNWARDRVAEKEAAEAAEKRKDSSVAREWEVALPNELDRRHRVELARDFAGEIANRYQGAVDVAIHRPHRLGDERNWHAHLLTTTRTIEADGLGRKTDIELGDRDRRKKGLARADEIVEMRARWAELANERLREHQIEARIDHRSLKDQGIDREATVHLGPSVIGMERRGVRTGSGGGSGKSSAARWISGSRGPGSPGSLRGNPKNSKDRPSTSPKISRPLSRSVSSATRSEAEARVEGKDALRAFRDELAQERAILKEMSLERAKELRRGKALQLENQRKLERDKGLERDGPGLAR